MATLTFDTIADRIAAVDSLEDLDRIGRTLAVQLASESAATMLFRLSLALDDRRAEIRRGQRVS